MKSLILRIVISSISIFLSCCIGRNNGNTLPHGNSPFDYCAEFNKDQFISMDSIFVETADELRNQLRNNRILILKNKKYELESTLQIDNIENLKIVGAKTSVLITSEQNFTVLKLLNSKNISIENIKIGHFRNQEHTGEQGVLRIEHSSQINILNCKISGAGTFGLITKDVCNLKFEDSEITKCTALIFELDKSRKIEFKNSKFQDNRLAISVLGGFTNSTKEVTFLGCEFLNNQPVISGNPAFNFNNNFQNFEEKIIFRNCTFKNNKGYKWYGEKIKLENCKIDSSDFIGIHWKKQ